MNTTTMHTRIILTISALLLGTVLHAQSYRTDTLSVGGVSFRQNVTVLEPEYRDNAVALRNMTELLSRLNADTLTIIRSVNVRTTASPEGSKTNNDRLSRGRAQSILTYLVDNTTLSPTQFKVNAVGEDWAGLVSILKDCREPWAPQALDLIRRSGVLEANTDERSENLKNELKALSQGAAWRWMNDNAFTVLRYAQGGIQCITSSQSGSGVKDTLYIFHREEIVHKDTIYMGGLMLVDGPYSGTPVRETKEKGYSRDSLFRVPVIAFRSNLLMPLMNVGMEIPLNNRFSLGLDWIYPWAMRQWMNSAFPAQQHCAQGLALSLEGRFWLGARHDRRTGDPRYRLRGHSLGIVGTAGYYDAEYDWKGQQGEIAALGFDYMYAAPLGRGGVHMEFNIGIGVAYNTYRNYDVRYEGGRLIGNGPRQSRIVPVPLRARISLVIPIFKKTTDNEKK